MGQAISILLDEHSEQFISNEVSSGRYSTASEVVRIALVLLEAEGSKNKRLDKALATGERSGFHKNFDAKSHLTKMHGKLK